MILWFLHCLRWSSLLFRCTCGGERDEKGQIACRRKTERGLLIWTQPKSRTNRKNVKRNTRNIKGLRISICCSHTIHTLEFSVLIFICQLRIPTTRKLTFTHKAKRRKKMVDIFVNCVKRCERNAQMNGCSCFGRISCKHTRYARKMRRTMIVSFSDRFQFVVGRPLFD